MCDLKTCTKCHEAKEKDACYYVCNGRHRSECKLCTIQRNKKYQQKSDTWKERHRASPSRRIYMRSYYAANKEKFSQYRREFKDRHPGYYKNYFEKNPRKNNAKL